MWRKSVSTNTLPVLQIFRADLRSIDSTSVTHRSRPATESSQSTDRDVRDEGMEGGDAEQKAQAVGIDKLNNVEDLLNCNK